jgi:hypothetical protein
LLRAQKNALVVLDVYRVGRGLVDGSEGQKEVPQADADLDAVGVGFTIVGSVGQLNLRGLLRVHAFLEYYLYSHASFTF